MIEKTRASSVIRVVDFLYCQRTCDFKHVLGSIYDTEKAARHFDTIHVILRSLGLAQSLVEGKNAPIWRSGNRGVKILSMELIKNGSCGVGASFGHSFFDGVENWEG